MTNFENHFLSFANDLNKLNITDYQDLINYMQSKLVTLTSGNKESIIILGFSGNGKSTYIKNFCQSHPDYISISWDGEIIKYLEQTGKKYQDLTFPEHTRVFGNALEAASNQGKNIILDGNFLNLPLRIAIINALHEYGYNVKVADLTPIIEETLKSRIDDEIKRYQANPDFSRLPKEEQRNFVANRIYAFKKDEEQRSAFESQRLYGAVSLGADTYLEYSELSALDNTKKI